MKLSELKNIKINCMKCDDQCVTEGFGFLGKLDLHFMIDNIDNEIIFELGSKQITTSSDSVIALFRQKIIYA